LGKGTRIMSENLDMRQDIESVLFTEEQISAMVERIGGEISRDYAGKNLLLVSVLKGSVVFMADLMRAVTIPARIDFMATSSYGSGVKTSGVVKIIKDLDQELAGYDIVIVEDILDSGKTLSYLTELLQSRGPKSIRICTLFDKPERREVEVTPTYVGSRIPDAFIVGYGLDYDEKYRNLPFVGVLKPSVYA
jgi:hypoxanthine phosphoribosyltransferase